MAKKEDLFGKLNMKDYNNQLEQILEKKDFSEDTKNFLLSMLYKVEISYNDYFIVKNISETKGEFITKILEIIDKECEEIQLIKPLDKEYQDLVNTKDKCIIEKDRKKIISLYNEQVLLYAIFKLKNVNYKLKKNVIEKPLFELFSNGEAMSAKEIIRDFDGWAWHTEAKSIEDIECNAIYQTISLIIGDNIKTKLELKKKIESELNEEIANAFYMLTCKLALLLYLKNNSLEINKYKKYKEDLQIRIEKIRNKSEYLSEITEKRKKLEARIKIIDKALIDVNFLKQEYIKTNKQLANNEKVFSISDFVEQLQEEKNIKICELQKYNKKMLPQSYMEEKQELEESLQILSVLDGEKNLDYYFVELQKCFIQAIQDKIEQSKTRKDIMGLLYRFRYYKNIPYKNRQIKDVKDLKEKICETENMMYNNASEMNALSIISVNSRVNNDVMQEILDTKIIELENIELLFVAENYQIVLKIFDEDNIEKTLEYNTIEGLTARMNKRFRLFIR